MRQQQADPDEAAEENGEVGDDHPDIVSRSLLALYRGFSMSGARQYWLADETPGVTAIELRHRQQHQQVGGIEIGIPRRLAAYQGA